MSQELWNEYGNPFSASFKKYLVMWDVPPSLEIGVIPKRIYLHKSMIMPLHYAFKSLIETGRVKELKTWDGCYNPRPIRGYEKQWKRCEMEGMPQAGAKYLSAHAWGLAIDVNAFENQLGNKPKLTSGFVKCFTNQGFIWGGNFKRLDGMHFELT